MSSCGAAGDKFTVTALSISPDPPVKGAPMTFRITGSLDEDVDAVYAAVDVDLKALGVIDKKVKQTPSVSLAPTPFKKGVNEVVVGPFSLPKDVPGSVEVVGTVKLTTKGAPLACIKLDLTLPAMQRSDVLGDAPGDAALLAPAAAEVAAATCRRPTDHAKNVQVSEAGNVTTVTATLDEALSAVMLDLDFMVHAIFFKIPVKFSVPVSITPGLAAGDFKVTVDRGAPTMNQIAPPVSISGQMLVKDGKDEEVTCVNIGVPAVTAMETVVI